jgi:hypothetical protein
MFFHKVVKTDLRTRINDFRFQIYKYFANQKSLIVNLKSKNFDIKDRHSRVPARKHYIELVHKVVKTDLRTRINDFRFQIYKYFANQKSLIVNLKSKNFDIKDRHYIVCFGRTFLARTARSGVIASIAKQSLLVFLMD